MYCCLALDLIIVAPPLFRGSFQIQTAGWICRGAVLPRRFGPVGIRTGRRSSNSPYPFAVLSLLRLFLSLAQERSRRSSPDLLHRVPSRDSVRWDRSPPRALAMDQGFSPTPSPCSLGLVFLGFGEACEFLRFLGLISARVG